MQKKCLFLCSAQHVCEQPFSSDTPEALSGPRHPWLPWILRGEALWVEREGNVVIHLWGTNQRCRGRPPPHWEQGIFGLQGARARMRASVLPATPGSPLAIPPGRALEAGDAARPCLEKLKERRRRQNKRREGCGRVREREWGHTEGSRRPPGGGGF